MAASPQSYANHARYQPLFHFVASPLTTLWAGHLIWQAIRHPGRAALVEALVATGICAGVWVSRIMVLTVQNRVIRLEMRLRLREVLPPDLAARSRAITVRQLIALRFASDAELPGLVERTLAGEFARPRDIKKAIRDWQPDHLRA